MSQLSGLFIPGAFKQHLIPAAVDTYTLGNGTSGRLLGVYAITHYATDGTILGNLAAVTGTGIRLWTTSSDPVVIGANSLPTWSFAVGGNLNQNATNGADLTISKAGTGIVLGSANSATIPAVVSGARGHPWLYIQSNASAAVDQMMLTAIGANGTGANIIFFKTRSNDGSASILSTTDVIGALQFYGSSATAMVAGAVIRATVNGSPSSGQMPTDIEFLTSDGAGTIVVQRITKNGHIVPVDTVRDLGTSTLYNRAVYATTHYITDGTRLGEIASVSGTGVRFWTTSDTDIVIGANSLPTWTFSSGGNLSSNATNGGKLIMSTVGQGVNAVLLGINGVPATVSSAFAVPGLLVVASNNNSDSMIFVDGGANAVGQHMYMGKCRSTGGAATSAAVNGDELFYIKGIAADGTSWRQGGGMQMVLGTMTGANNFDTQLNLSARTGSTTTIGFSIMGAGTPKTYLTTAGGAVPIVTTNAPSGTGVLQYINWNNNGTAGYILFVPA